MSSPYRSGPPRHGHIEGLDELEAKLRRGVRIRRLVMGFLSLVTGLGMIVTGTMLVMQRSGLGGRGMFRTSLAMVLFGVLLSVIAFVILRRGELKADQGLDVEHEDPIPWSTLGPVSAGILVVVGLVAAYPLGVYRWAGALRSPCRSVFTPKDAAAMGLPPFAMEQITDDSLQCTMSGVNSGHRTVHVTLAADKGGSQFENELSFLGGRREPLAGMGDEAYLLERRGERIIVVRRRHAAMFVHLASPLYDRDAAMKVAKHLEPKVSLLEPFADVWKKRYGSD